MPIIFMFCDFSVIFATFADFVKLERIVKSGRGRKSFLWEEQATEKQTIEVLHKKYFRYND